MSREDLIRIAREARMPYFYQTFEIANLDGLERFANLIRADERNRAMRENAYVLAEREACAKLCDDLDDDLPDGLAGWQYGEAIRARKTT